jgi:nitrate reductase gamma subunit
MSDLFLFGVFPYVALALAVGGTAYRYRRLRHTVTARSSQLMESRLLFWGSVPWHASILVILLAHLGAAAFPGAWASLLGSPGRLLVLEATGLALGALALLGIAVLLLRRLSLPTTTGAMDWAVLVLLALQTATGLWIAFALRWGSAWYLHTAAPWLASLVRLAPQVDGMAALPAVVQVHALNAFVLVALLPFSRLVHLTVLPVSYLWRPPQVVIWRRAPAPTHRGTP